MYIKCLDDLISRRRHADCFKMKLNENIFSACWYTILMRFGITMLNQGVCRT
jgi:hypothetical protein